MKSKTPPEKKSLKKSASPIKKSKPAQKEKVPSADSNARKEIKNLKATLHTNEEKFQAILNNIEDGYYESDLAGSITFFNDSLCRIAGRNKKEIMGLNYRQYVSEKTAKEMHAIYHKVYTTGRGIKRFVHELYTKKGDLKFVETSITLRKDRKGSKIGFQGIVRDITDRKAAEEALEKREERYRTVLEDIDDEYFELDLAGNFVFVNDSLVHYLGYPKANLIGMNYQKCCDKESGHKMNDCFKEVYQTGTPFKNVEVSLIAKDGSIRYTETSGALMRNGDGKPIGFSIVSRDVTERKKEEERYRILMENIEEGYFELDLKGKVTFVNDAHCQKLGYTREEAIGMSFRRYTNESMTAKARQIYANIYKTGQPARYEIEYIKKNGDKHYCEVSASVINDARGNPIGFRGISLDISGRKQMEADLREREEKYKTILDSIDNGYYEVDLAGNLTFFNDSMCRIWGYPKEELMGMNNRQYADEENARKLYETFNQVYRTEIPTKAFDWQVRRKDGNIVFIEASVALRKDSAGNKIGFMGIVRDITERKHAEDELRQNQYFLIKSQEVAQIGSYKVDSRTGRWISSRVLDNILGIDENYQKTPQGWFNLIHPDERQDIKRFLYETIKIHRKRLFDTSLRIVRQNDGQERWVQAKGELTYDQDGNAITMIGTIQDITDRKQMEDEILESERKYRSIVENAQEGIFQASPDTQKISMNNAFAAMLGYDSPQDVYGDITELAKQVAADPDEFLKVRDILRRDGSIKSYETQLHRKDKSLIWVSMSITAVKDNKGGVVYHGIVEDITPKKKLEQERQASLQSLRKSLGATIKAMSATVEARDPYTAGHQRRVSDLARSIATEMKMSRDQIDCIRLAGIIHDLGKISVPSEILTKPTRLSNLEFELIRTHSEAGYSILKDIEFPWPIARIVLEHHERIDGSGYPNKLKADELLLESKIIAIADVVEAISSNRPYRPAVGIQAALEEIEKNKGILYDSVAAEACIRLFREKHYKMPD
ncbi:MAG: domain S-box-containing protein/HDIG protein [Deltaproteobacteria bacterium]|nr:domain S-box-containing protein/HDIG protein [Deltaproteobacteria bacterium]